MKKVKMTGREKVFYGILLYGGLLSLIAGAMWLAPWLGLMVAGLVALGLMIVCMIADSLDAE